MRADDNASQSGSTGPDAPRRSGTRSGHGGLKVRYRPQAAEGNCVSSRTVEDALASYLRHLTPASSKASERRTGLSDEKTADAVLDLLVGTRKTRLGSAPTSDNKLDIWRRILQSIEINCPIPVALIWGPKKHYVSLHEQGVDLAELVALETLNGIHVQIRKTYHPGLHYTVFLLDSEGQYIWRASREDDSAMAKYAESFSRLIGIVGIQQQLTLVKTSSRLTDPTAKTEVANQLDENFKAFSEYWQETEAGIEDRSYPSLDRLAGLGWSGHIPMQTRQYFEERMRRMRPHLSDEERVQEILRNFSVILMHRQIDLLRGDGPVPPLKFSFVGVTPGFPSKLGRGRLNMRIASTDVTGRHMPPWTCKGYVRVKGETIGPTIGSWNETIQPPRSVRKAWLTLMRDNESVSIRADQLTVPREAPSGGEI